MLTEAERAVTGRLCSRKLDQDARGLPQQQRRRNLDLVLIDCEKDDYIRFFDLLHLAPGALVVADNILSHDLAAYVRHVRSRPGVESVTLPIGKGLEVSRITTGGGQPA